MDRLDAAIFVRLSDDALWPRPTEARAYERTLELLALHAELRDGAATMKQLEVSARRVKEAIEVGLGPSTGRAGGHLRTLLDLRARLRDDGFPVEIDGLLDRELAALRVEDLEKNAGGSLDDALLLRSRARELGAGPQAIAVADAMTNAAVVRVLAEAKALADRSDFFAATELLNRYAHAVEGELRERRLVYAAAGRDQSMARAASLGTTGRAYLEYSRAVALGGGVSERAALRSKLGVSTSLPFKAEVSAPDACADVAKDVGGAYPESGVPGRLTVTITSCPTSSRETMAQRSEPYQSIVSTWEEREVQVGTRSERVAVGSHKVQCSQPSSLPGMVWQGLCDVTDYETKSFPVYETQRFEVKKEETLSYSYDVRVHRVEATVTARARLVTDEGEVLTVEAEARRWNDAETYSYELPGLTKDARTTPRSQTLPSGFSPQLPLREASSEVRSTLASRLLAALVAHRAKLMREKALRAQTEGRTDDATDAHVLATLIDGKLESESTDFLSKVLKRDGNVVRTLLTQNDAWLVGPVGEVKLPEAKAYAPTGLLRKDDKWEVIAAGLSRDVSPTTDTYHEGIFPPNEFFDVHGGIVPGEVQVGNDIGGRVGVMAALDGHYSPLEYLGLRYFFAVHDELGIRFTLGMSTAKAREFDSGGTESPIAWSLDAHYALYAGLRLPWFSLMAGARIGIMHAAVGEVQAGGFHFEPAVRVALRLFEIKQLVLEASGIWGIPGLPHKNRFALSFPILGKDGIDLSFTVEQTLFNATDLAQDGTTRMPLGLRPVNQAGVQIGARL
jgi:hypothetical protein